MSSGGGQEEKITRQSEREAETVKVRLKKKAKQNLKTM